MIRAVLRRLSYLVVLPLRPVKVYAYRTRFGWVRRVILTLTTPIDFALIWANVQNATMLLHWRVYGGNFVFGRGVMVTDHATTAEAIARPGCRGNNFMGVSIVASDASAFGTNAGVLNQCPPVRQSTREYLDRTVFTPAVMAHTADTVREQVGPILGEWAAHPKTATAFVIRTAVTRVFLKLLSGVTVPEPEADAVTRQYIRRFVELSLFGGYFPAVLDLLGTHKGVRRDAYFKLKEYGIDLLTIDITLFAAMFSVGTLVLRCVEDTRRFGIRYAELDRQRKRHFVIEAVRLDPTVTSVHRIVERDETIRIRGKDIRLTPGDEVVYPFVCANRDPAAFANPERMDLDRPAAEYERVLSWSAGPHSCPAKELSILVTVLMLDELSRKFELSTLRIWNPAF